MRDSDTEWQIGETRLNHSLIVGIAWTEHHSVLAKGWLPVAIGRDVADGQ